MSRSMRILVAVSMFAGLFEAFAASTSSEGRAVIAGFAAVFLLGGLALWARQSLAVAVVVGLALLVDVAGVPFYERSALTDYLVQFGFGAVGVVGLAACINVLRTRRGRHTLPNPRSSATVR